MRVLVACEESQEVCKAFRAKGHEAYSCDLQECSGGHPEWHIKADALEILKIKWDLIIAHPPCTYLSNAGARWLYAGKKLNEERYKQGLNGKAFFMQFFNADCERIAIENPIPSSVYQMPQYTQVIEPYFFGEPWSKKTCLWLKNLPPLLPTELVRDHRPYCSSGSYSRSHDPKYKGASRRGGGCEDEKQDLPGHSKGHGGAMGMTGPD